MADFQKNIPALQLSRQKCGQNVAKLFRRTNLNAKGQNLNDIP
jgi:hypothetical protein